MTLVLPNAGEAAMLDAALKTASPEALTLKLYSNNYDAVETSVAGSFTECTGSGYAAKSLTRAGWNAAVTASSGTITCTVAASAKTFTRSTGSFITDGFKVGQSITTSGFVNGGNNGTFTITGVTATVITCSGAAGLVDESNTATAVFSGPTFSLYSAAQTFTFTGAITVVGYYLVGASSGTLYWAERLFAGAGQAFADSDSLNVTPYFEQA